MPEGYTLFVADILNGFNLTDQEKLSISIALDLARKGACTLFPSVAADFPEEPVADLPAFLPQSKLTTKDRLATLRRTYRSEVRHLPASRTLLQQHDAALSPQDHNLSEIKDFWFRTSEAVLIKVDDGIVG